MDKSNIWILYARKIVTEAKNRVKRIGNKVATKLVALIHVNLLWFWSGNMKKPSWKDVFDFVSALNERIFEISWFMSFRSIFPHAVAFMCMVSLYVSFSFVNDHISCTNVTLNDTAHRYYIRTNQWSFNPKSIFISPLNGSRNKWQWIKSELSRRVWSVCFMA